MKKEIKQTEIIKLFDNEGYEYPLIEIKSGHNIQFGTILDKYRENATYNIDDFLLLLEKEKWFIRTIYFDSEVFF